MENAQHQTFLINSFLNVRKKTMELIKNLNPEDMVIQTESFVSPIKWHLAHTTWFFENFVLKNLKNYKIFDKSFNYIFNSYYYSVGSFNPKDMRGYLNRPEIKKIFNSINEYSAESEILFVGGCVRQNILGEKIEDIDLATNLNPDEVVNCLNKNNIGCSK